MENAGDARHEVLNLNLRRDEEELLPFRRAKRYQSEAEDMAQAKLYTPPMALDDDNVAGLFSPAGNSS